MPRLSVWFVRCSFIHLFLGFSFGGIILANKGIPFAPWAWTLLPAHMEFLLLGWMMQLAMGVAFWILPRIRSDAPRGNVRLVWASLGLLNLGIGIVALQPFFRISWFTLAGRVLEASAVMLFVLASWKRIRPI